MRDLVIVHRFQIDNLYRALKSVPDFIDLIGPRLCLGSKHQIIIATVFSKAQRGLPRILVDQAPFIGYDVFQILICEMRSG